MKMFNLLNEATMDCIVNEAYYGPNGSIKKCREAFQEFYDLVVSDIHGNHMGSKEVNTFTKLLQDQFGFKRVVFIEPPLGDPFICTFPVIVFGKNKGNCIEETIHGVRFKRDTNFEITIIVPNGAFLKVSADELFAVILHEIGHSFVSILKFDSNNAVNEFVLNVRDGIKSVITRAVNKGAVTVYDLLKDRTFIGKVTEPIYRLASIVQNNKLFQIFNAFKYAKTMLTFHLRLLTSAKNCIYILTKFSGNPADIVALFAELNMFMSVINNVATRGTANINSSNMKHVATNAEYFSDSFAVMYGYGTHLATALNNLLAYRQDKSISGILNSIGNIQMAFAETVHPDNYQRTMSMIAHLRQELSQNKLIDKNTRSEISNQILQLEGILVDMVNSKDKNLVYKLYNDLMTLKKNATQKALDKSDYSFGLNRG